MSIETISELKKLKEWIEGSIRRGVSEASGRCVIRRIEQRIALLESRLPTPEDFGMVPKRAVSERLTERQKKEEEEEWGRNYLEGVYK